MLTILLREFATIYVLVLVYGIDFYYVVILRRLVFPWFAAATFRKALYNENDVITRVVIGVLLLHIINKFV